MPFTAKGQDVAMRRNEAVGRLDLDWDATGNPRYSDDNVHRVLSLLLERRPSPGLPGWWADETGERGSLLYTDKNLTRTTPSEVESHCRDALRKAEDEGWVSDVRVKAFLRPADRARVEVAWKNPGGKDEAVRLALR